MTSRAACISSFNSTMTPRPAVSFDPATRIADNRLLPASVAKPDDGRWAPIITIGISVLAVKLIK